MRRKLKQPNTILEQIAFSYADLARADKALKNGRQKYTIEDHIVRDKLRRGLIEGTMRMRSLYDDERIKMKVLQACYYCGDKQQLCVDHLIPKMRGGPDASDNLIWSCRSCNSSKGGKNLLEWMNYKNIFPPLLLLRRYTKTVARYCEEHELLDLMLDHLDEGPAMPFDVRMLPTKFPPLEELTLWIGTSPTELKGIR